MTQDERTMSERSSVWPDELDAFERGVDAGTRRAVAQGSERVAQHLRAMIEHAQPGDAHELSIDGRETGAAEDLAVGYAEFELREDRVELVDLGCELVARSAVDRGEVLEPACLSLVGREGLADALLSEKVCEGEERVQRARESAVGDALDADLAEGLAAAPVHAAARRAQAHGRVAEDCVVGAAQGSEGDAEKSAARREAVERERAIDPVGLPESLARVARDGSASAWRAAIRKSVRIASVLLAAVALAACERAATTTGDPQKPIVRFMKDPIRVDGVERTMRRTDFHRAAVLRVAKAWLPVLALEARLGDLCREERVKGLDPQRVLDLMKLVENDARLHARFPSFPTEKEPVSTTCCLRLATCLARLEALEPELKPSDDPAELALRIEAALKQVAPRLTDTGAACKGVAIDAREVWPDLLARSELSWREDLVRELLMPAKPGG